MGSTVAMVVLFERGASLDRLYYGTDTRAAELLVGALLAVVLHERPLAADGRLRQVLPVAGLVAAGISVWAWTSLELTDDLLYRGGFMVVATASGGLIISVLGGQGPLAQTLSLVPVAAFGRITYGVYVFHWPLYLWLTESRTGLDQGPLLVLRVAITLAVATASYHLLEMPIRQRAWGGAFRNVRWAVPPAVACILVGAMVVNTRDVQTDLAGLGEAGSAVPTLAVQGDGVLDVLLIADSSAPTLGAELRDVAEATADLRVEVAEPFSCAEVAADASLCTNWRDEWPALIESFDPDVVLFHVTRWDVEEIAARSDSDELGTQTGWTVAALSAGFDLLSAQGATVVWSQDPLDDMAEAVRRTNEPFYPAMLQVTSERSDTRRRNQIGSAIGPLLEDLALYQRPDPNPAPRLMVVGDSVARTVGYGLERWSADDDEAVVWTAAREGCGIADDGQVRDASGRTTPVPAYCHEVAGGWREAIEQFDPQVILVISEVFDLQPRQLQGWPGFLAPGDPAFDDYLIEEYTNLYDILAAGGATVVWFNIPCAQPSLAGTLDRSAFDIERIRHVNDVILGRLADARPGMRTFDLFDALCPEGEYTKSLGDVGVVRTDGVHFSPEGSLWFAEEHGQALLELGLGRGPAP